MKNKSNLSTKEIKEMADNIVSQNMEIKSILEKMMVTSRIIGNKFEGSLSSEWYEAANSYKRKSELIVDKARRLNKDITSYVSNTIENEKMITNNISNINDNLNNIYHTIDDIDI